MRLTQPQRNMLKRLYEGPTWPAGQGTWLCYALAGKKLARCTYISRSAERFEITDAGRKVYEELSPND